MKNPSNGQVIGISAGWMHGDDQRQRFNGRPLFFVERSMVEWVLGEEGMVPMMIPGVGPTRGARWDPKQFIDAVDGLVLQGGADVAPQSYGEEPLRPEWSGDGMRDDYELALIEAAVEAEVPILGICRGHQILNVAFGGTLYQDIEAQRPGARVHRDGEAYQDHLHQVVLDEGGRWREAFGVAGGWVNSVHHQGIKELAQGMKVEARSIDDELIEAIRWEGSHYVVGVQWHPEFQRRDQGKLLDPQVILRDFKEAVGNRKGKG